MIINVHGIHILLSIWMVYLFDSASLFEDVVEGAKLVEEERGCLLADPVHAFHVVCRVSEQGLRAVHQARATQDTPPPVILRRGAVFHDRGTHVLLNRKPRA